MRHSWRSAPVELRRDRFAEQPQGFPVIIVDSESGARDDVLHARIGQRAIPRRRGTGDPHRLGWDLIAYRHRRDQGAQLISVHAGAQERCHRVIMSSRSPTSRMR